MLWSAHTDRGRKVNVMDGSFTVFDAIEAFGPALASGGACGGSAAAAPPDYLESVRKHCGREEEKEECYEVAACGCRSRFCAHCCVGRGLSLRERLIPVLCTFTGLQMWTFTVDPKLFSSPKRAFDYVRANRCISETIRQLRRKGFLHSARYFAVVEWQMGEGNEKGTEMAHWHVLLDASYIPFDVVCEIWNRFRPDGAGPVEGDRPGFGSVRFSVREFDGPRHAASYACKYVIKHPEKGFPAWVLDSCDIHRFSTSRGFWSKACDDSEEVEANQAAVDDEPEELQSAATVEKVRTSIRERLAQCGEKSVVVKVVECMDEETGELKEQRQFVCRLSVPLATVAGVVGRCVPEGKRRLCDLPGSVLRLLTRYRDRSGENEPEHRNRLVSVHEYLTTVNNINNVEA
jgi:hypothetical protein